MFESADRLRAEIQSTLHTLREGTGGRYACVVERKGVLLESAEPESPSWPIRQFLEARLAELFAIPAALQAEQEFGDVFAEWESPAGQEEDEFLLAFVNAKVGFVLVCPDAEEQRAQLRRPMEALADRLLRLNAAWRVDEKGRGLFLGRARLDIVAITRPPA
jgi:hypothetical protein